MLKNFITYNEVRDNAIKLACKIYKDAFIPDVIYVSLRGGAYIGNLISEYFKIVRKKERPVFYAAVVARSYTDIKNQEEVRIDGWTYNPKHLRQGDKILLIDDIFDSGKTINCLSQVIINQGIPRSDLKIAVHDYKIYTYLKQSLKVYPDYYCRKHYVDSEEKDIWIHYLSHELVGLTEKEYDKYYFSHDPDLRDALNIRNIK